MEPKVLSRDDPALLEHYGWALRLFPKATFVRTPDGVIRFQGNRIFRYLIDNQKVVDLNKLWVEACCGKFTLKEMMDLYIGLGYTLSGFVDIFPDGLNLMEDRGLTFETLTDERVRPWEDEAVTTYGLPTGGPPWPGKDEMP